MAELVLSLDLETNYYPYGLVHGHGKRLSFCVVRVLGGHVAVFLLANWHVACRTCRFVLILE